MSILNLRFREATTPNGKTISPAAGLRTVGPRVPVRIGLHPAAEEALVRANTPVPSPIAGVAVVDTGASITSVDQATAKQLGLAEVDTVRLGTAGGSRDMPAYAFSFEVPGLPKVECTRGMGCDLAGQDIIMLLGMDMLSGCVLIVNGPDGSFTISF